MTEGMRSRELRKAWGEVKLVSRFRHEHIIAYFAVFEDKGILHLILEYAEGGTLDRAIQAAILQDAPFPTSVVARWILQMADALQHMHAHYVLHRDLSAKNVLLSAPAPTGDIRVADFGLARDLERSGQMARTLCGTPTSLSPEQFAGLPYGASSDVWALGVLAFELATLKQPFHAESLFELCAMIQGSGYDEAALRRSPHPEVLRQLLSRTHLLHPDPAARSTLKHVRAVVAMISSSE